jgi:hypothetical protein
MHAARPHIFILWLLRLLLLLLLFCCLLLHSLLLLHCLLLKLLHVQLLACLKAEVCRVLLTLPCTACGVCMNTCSFMFGSDFVL